MNKLATEASLLAVHAIQPLSARWFGLASYLLASGYTIGLYEPDGFDADAPDGSAVEVHLDEEDGSCYWGFDWISGDGHEHDEDHASSWQDAVITCGAVVEGLVVP